MMHPHATHLLRTTRRLGPLAMALALGAGCAQQVEPDVQSEPDAEPAVSQSVLDPEMLAAALQQQATLDAQGVILRERAWMSPDAYVASYETPEGADVSTQLIGKNSISKAMPVMREEETFEEFAQRMTPRTALRVRDLAVDRLWFEPPPPTEVADDSIGKSTAALSDLEQVAQILAACDSMARSNCKQPVGYYQSGGPTAATVKSWSRTGQPDAMVSARGSSFYTAVCAHGHAVSFQWFSSRYQFYTLDPSALVQSVPPLAFFSLAVGTGWKRHHCGLLEICKDYVDFNQADHFINALAGGGGPIQTFCGKVTDQPRMWFGGTCEPRLGLNCTGFERPTNVVRSIVSN